LHQSTEDRESQRPQQCLCWSRRHNSHLRRYKVEIFTALLHWFNYNLSFFLSRAHYRVRLGDEWHERWAIMKGSVADNKWCMTGLVYRQGRIPQGASGHVLGQDAEGGVLLRHQRLHRLGHQAAGDSSSWILLQGAVQCARGSWSQFIFCTSTCWLTRKGPASVSRRCEGSGQDVTHLAPKENTQSEIFLFGKLKILIAFCSVRALI
jgi:hypothetical protein